VGQIYHAKAIKTERMYIIKEINSSDMEETQIKAEFMLANSSECSNLVNSYELYKYDDAFYIVQEKMDGKLTGLIRKFPLTEDIIRHILKEILTGLEYIHRNNFIHRDLKSDNIFINRGGEVKIGDFGSVAQLSVERNMRETQIGSLYWMAPELFEMKPYSNECDIWAVGIILFELAERRVPYASNSYEEVSGMVLGLEPPQIGKKWSKGLKKFAEDCLQKVPALRKSASQLLNGKYMQSTKSKRQDLIRLMERC
jgi:serine/threonine-protein kinase 24/25/MST4